MERQLYDGSTWVGLIDGLSASRHHCPALLGGRYIGKLPI